MHSGIKGSQMYVADTVHAVLELYNPTSGERPNMRELIRFQGRNTPINIPQRIGTKWDDFGIFLLRDDHAAIVDSIAKEQRDRPEQINKEILKRWIQGGGQPVTWETLVGVLRDIELNELADGIASVKCTKPVTNPNDPSVNDPSVMSLSVINPSVTSHGAINPSVTSPGAINPSVTSPGAINPSVTSPGVINPSVTNPGVINPSVLDPGVINPSVLNPGVINPSVTSPGVTGPSVTSPGAINPSVTSPGVKNPSVRSARHSCACCTIV